MKQPVFIDRIISYVGLDNGIAKENYTHAGSVTLFKNKYSAPGSGNFKYSSVVGIMS